MLYDTNIHFGLKLRADWKIGGGGFGPSSARYRLCDLEQVSLSF